jgi:hypothetical protein
MVRYAEQLAHDGHREFIGEVIDELAALGRCQLIGQGLGDGPDESTTSRNGTSLGTETEPTTAGIVASREEEEPSLPTLAGLPSIPHHDGRGKPALGFCQHIPSSTTRGTGFGLKVDLGVFDQVCQVLVKNKLPIGIHSAGMRWVLWR